jgi:hypothetical protein
LAAACSEPFAFAIVFVPAFVLAFVLAFARDAADPMHRVAVHPSTRTRRSRVPLEPWLFLSRRTPPPR